MCLHRAKGFGYILDYLGIAIDERSLPPKKWTAIVHSSLVFGLMHHGVASSNFDMTTGIFFSMLIINGIGGFVFGALFIFMGLEFAIIAHFTADVVLHVAGPMLVKE
ncbi:CPBP family intramembrane metalloprotease [Bacillus haikouensis]|uniref:CPBP family glutamic-type intramembrane protease n=1 Tax=Bacillus haikouensis TaxID=1510468 RepID=UPI00155316B5|nr:CPBP family glutamic-type intramembrane protease [Bacillus haikouensis]NQD64389.1 CPBP family intramembrane metalloprotease [Bacillus haikouensis]